MSSNATIFNFEPPPVNHTFAPITDNPRETYISPFQAILTNSSSALGIGDLRLRGKYVAWRDAKEKSAVAVGLDLRLPTGDAYNFLGSGTWGIRPFVIYSYSARVSPHASAGFRRQSWQFDPGRRCNDGTGNEGETARCVYLLRGRRRLSGSVVGSVRRLHRYFSVECVTHRKLDLHGFRWKYSPERQYLCLHSESVKYLGRSQDPAHGEAARSPAMCCFA